MGYFDKTKNWSLPIMLQNNRTLLLNSQLNNGHQSVYNLYEMVDRIQNPGHSILLIILRLMSILELVVSKGVKIKEGK